jgi:hypothetical protein
MFLDWDDGGEVFLFSLNIRKIIRISNIVW